MFGETLVYFGKSCIMYIGNPWNILEYLGKRILVNLEYVGKHLNMLENPVMSRICWKILEHLINLGTPCITMEYIGKPGNMLRKPWETMECLGSTVFQSRLKYFFKPKSYENRSWITRKDSSWYGTKVWAPELRRMVQYPPPPSQLSNIQ